MACHRHDAPIYSTLLAAMGPDEILDPSLVDLSTRVGDVGIRFYGDKVEPSLMVSRALVFTLCKASSVSMPARLSMG